MKNRSLHFNMSDEAIAGYQFAAKAGITTAVAGTTTILCYIGIKSLKHRVTRILAASAAGTAIIIPYVTAIFLEYRDYVLKTKGEDILEIIIDKFDAFVAERGGDVEYDDFDDFAHEEFDDDFFDDDLDDEDPEHTVTLDQLDQMHAEEKTAAQSEVDTTGNNEE